MKCFLLPCFSSKRQKHFSSKPAYTTILHTHHDTDLEESIHWISQSKIEENETTLKEEKCCTIENKDNHEEECSDSLFSVSITCGKPVSVEENLENEVNSTPIKLHHAKDEPKSEEQPNEAKDCSDDDINLDGDEKTGDEERSSESSLFSLSTDYNCRKRISFSSTTEKEVSSKMVQTQEESDDAFSSVLNPIENVVKVAKATVLHSVKKDKENMNWDQKEKEEIGVDTSLSSWLVKSDRQILGELKVEEIRKYYSPNVSSKSSTSLSPQETPIIGTVGSYWNHSKSNKFGKDGKQDWSSTAIIKTRLEPAFEFQASVAQN